MPIKWNPLKVNEAMDKVEEQVNQVIEPLEKARLAAREALNIPNLPQYVTQHINRIIGDIDDKHRLDNNPLRWSGYFNLCFGQWNKLTCL